MMQQQQQRQQQQPSFVPIGHFPPAYPGPPGNVIQVPNGGQPTTLVVAPRTSTGNVSSYNRRQSVGLGATLIVIGCLSITFNIADLVVNDDGEILSLGFVGHGIWSGALCIATGGVGIAAGNKTSNCLITTFLVMCICASVTCFCQMAIGIAGSVTATDCYSGRLYDNCEQAAILIGMESMLAILGLAGVIPAAWGAAICCQAGFCGDCNCCMPKTPVQIIRYGAPANWQAQPGGQQTTAFVSAPPNYTASPQLMVQPGAVRLTAQPNLYESIK